MFVHFPGLQQMKVNQGIGVLFDGVGRKLGGDSWFARWFHHLPGKPIYLP